MRAPTELGFAEAFSRTKTRTHVQRKSTIYVYVCIKTKPKGNGKLNFPLTRARFLFCRSLYLIIVHRQPPRAGVVSLHYYTFK